MSNEWDPDSEWQELNESGAMPASHEPPAYSRFASSANPRNWTPAEETFDDDPRDIAASSGVSARLSPTMSLLLSAAGAALIACLATVTGILPLSGWIAGVLGVLGVAGIVAAIISAAPDQPRDDDGAIL